MRVLHVIDQLRPGGPLQALIAAAKQSHPENRIAHHIFSIKAADRRACAQASAAGIEYTSVADAAFLHTAMAAADIVQVHFWNNPLIHDFLAGDLPPIRLLLWCHVNGVAAPHIIPRLLVDRSDITVATASSTLDLPVFREASPARTALVESTADFTRLSGLKRLPHDDFRIGYLGSLDFAKLHQSFVSMCAAVTIPSARFLLCGEGSGVREIKRQARALGLLERLEFYGYTEDLRSVLGQFDVFGYPLNADTFATAELSLQEAMYAGVSPVVFRHQGPEQIVQNAVTGMVVDSESEYVAAIEWLYRHPDERTLFGKNAALAMFERLQRSSIQSDAIYLRLMDHSKRPRPRMYGDDLSLQRQAKSSRGAWSFIRSLDGGGDRDFVASLSGATETEVETAEQKIAQANPNMHNVILQYCSFYREDPHLHLWTGLVLRRNGHPALAASQFRASIALGQEDRRVHRYFEDSVRAATLSRQRPRSPAENS